MAGTVVNIEYHSVCPACGAAGGGREICEYCGANLIKNRSEESFGEGSLEERNAMEDLGLPIEHGKSCETDKFMLMFCLIFGGMFVTVPTILCVVFISVGIFFWPMIFFFGIFWVIGFGALMPIILPAVNRKKCKQGPVVTGELRGYEESMVMMNGRPILNMRIRMWDSARNSDKIVLLSSGETVRRYPAGAQMSFRNSGKYYMLVQK